MPPKVPLSLSTRLTLSELQPLTQSQQLLRLYRRFIRLSIFIPSRKHRLTYSSLLRDRFTIGFNSRHKKVLGIDPGLTHIDLIARTINTLELVNEAFTYNDKMSTDIIMNLIKLEQSKIIYASKNQKDRTLEGKFKQYEYHDDKKTLELTSLKEYDKTLMRFNETMNMCL